MTLKKLSKMKFGYNNNKRVVMEAVKQDGMELQYASKQMQMDKDVVLAAITQNKNAMKFVDLC